MQKNYINREINKPLTEIQRGINPKTNKPHPAGDELLYHQYPEYYTWNKTTKKWKRRINVQHKPCVGRM